MRPSLNAAVVALVASALLATAAHAVNVRTLFTPLGPKTNGILGTTVSSAGDVNGDGYDDVIAGAYLADSGNAYVYFGGPGADATANIVLAGNAPGAFFGSSVSSAGDVNGDGFGDFIVGESKNGPGHAYVYFGGPTSDDVPDLVLDGEAANDQFGAAVSGAGDVNGDGYADVIVGAFWNSAAGVDAGRAYVYFGGASPDAVADLVFTAEAASDLFGATVASAGDVNGDGYADVLVGADSNDSAAMNAGRAYLYFGGPAADGIADLVFDGEGTAARAGAVAGAGDVNGDGYADVLVGAGNTSVVASLAGRAYLHLGGPDMDNVPDMVFNGEALNRFGSSVSGAGDVNGDAYADWVVGAPTHPVAGGDAGRVYVYFGGPSADATPDLIFNGEGPTNFFGIAVSSAGDLNGDGFDDIVVGAHTNAQGGTTAGKVYVYDAYRYVLTSPSGGETWPVGSTQSVTWLGRDLADLWISTDGGGTYVRIESGIGGVEENEHAVLVPHMPTRFARIKLTPYDTSLLGRDHSDSLFTIETSISLLTFAVRARPGGGAELSWATNPSPGVDGIAGYRLYRHAPGATPGDRGTAIGPSLIKVNTFVDAAGDQGSSYRLTAVNGLGEEYELGREVLVSALPLEAWPSPYRGGTMQVTFAARDPFTGGAGRAHVALFDAAGRRVRTLVDGVFTPGTHIATWDGRDESGRAVPGGVYFLKLRVEGNSRRVKVVVAP